jgi:hypothetical protein
MNSYKDILEKQIKELEKRIAESTWEKEELKRQLSKLKGAVQEEVNSGQQLLKG